MYFNLNKALELHILYLKCEAHISVCEALPHSRKHALPLVHRREAHSGPCDGGTKLGLEHWIHESSQLR